VNEIIVSEVPEDSLTEKAGVKPGDRVIRINGRPAESFTAGVTRESELGRIFIDRPPGETVQLEILAADARTPFSLTLESESVSSILRKFKFERP
jgi:C-terminal processing protease CtpA/Prc